MTAQAPAHEHAAPLGPDVWRIRNRQFTSNTYVCVLEDRDRCIVVDPGLDQAALEETLTALRVRPRAVFCTHGHFDHIAGAAWLSEAYGAQLHLHGADQKVARTANFTMMVCKVEGRIRVPDIGVLASDESRYLEGGDEVRYVHTPGHTPGSSFVCFRDYVFTGDTLYRDSVGLVRFPGEDPAQLRASLLKAWEHVPEASFICPGHGGAGPFSALKRSNQELRAFLGITAAMATDTPR